MPSMAGLFVVAATGLAIAIGCGVPVVPLLGWATGIVFIQWAIAPYIIEWVIPAQVIPHDGTEYLANERVGAIVARRCRDAGVPLVRLGIVDDWVPNAFTFGHSKKYARLWITRGLLIGLDDAELDAVVCHELGHVRNRDFQLMTIASLVPAALYFIAVGLLHAASDDDGDADDEGGGLVFLVAALAAFILYFVSELLLLSLSRAREYAADHWSCACTGDGDALAAALVKVTYGVADPRQHAREVQAHGGAESKAAQRRYATRVLGIADLRAVGGRRAHSLEDDLPQVAAMQWELVSPWSRILEKFSSHPMVARRIEALEASGLPGAPRRWSVARSLAGLPQDAHAGLHARVASDLFTALAPWTALVLLGGAGLFVESAALIGIAFMAGGLLLLAKQQRRYAGSPKATTIAALHGRVDAGPVAGIPVELRGRVIGRGVAGSQVSPDLVLDDGTGFVRLDYRSWIPLATLFFGLRRAERFRGARVVAQGWYRRLPEPVVELRRLDATNGTSARSRWYVGCWLFSAALIGVGAGVIVAAAF